MNGLYKSILYECGNNISGEDRKEFIIPDDIFEEYFSFEPIEPRLSKPDSDESTNPYDVDK